MRIGSTTPAEREAKIAEAKRLRAAGVDFKNIGRALCINETTAHMWVDPDYAQSRREQINEARRHWRKQSKSVNTHAVFNHGLNDAEIMRRLREIPEDTRSLTGRLLGDPLPGRSA